MMPARYISAIASMIPEPQTPVTPIFTVASANPGSSDQRSHPITLKRGSRVVRSMRTRSIAPGAARWPEEICAPSKAGPDGDEEPQFVAEIRRLGQHDASRVGADVAGDAGERIDESAGRNVEPDFARPRLIGAVDRQRERSEE